MNAPTWHRTSTGQNLVGHNGQILATAWNRRTINGGYVFRCGDLFAERETFASAKAAAESALSR
jgi:hypothetical protein